MPRFKLDQAVNLFLDQWAKSYKITLEKAFKVGGHQLHGGQRWKALGEKTVQRKGSNKILVDSGVLAKGFKITSGKLTVLISNKVSYAKYHQDGRGVPKRKVIDFTSSDKQKLLRDLKIKVERMLRGT